MALERLCTLDDCMEKHYARGFCKKHYKRFVENPKKSAQTAKHKKLALIRQQYNATTPHSAT